MGGTQLKYNKISEFNFNLIKKTNQIVFNHDFSKVFMIQEYENGYLLIIMQFKNGKIKILRSQRICQDQIILLPLKNSPLSLQTSRINEGILLNQYITLNNNKYLINLNIQKKQQQTNSKICCLIINNDENLIVSGGYILNGLKKANLEFWTNKNEWKMIQQLTYNDNSDSSILKINFNQSETQVISYLRINQYYYIIIYCYEAQYSLWVQKDKYQFMCKNQFCCIDDRIFVVRSKRVKSNILGSCSLQDVLQSYVLNQEMSKFDFKMEQDDQGSFGNENQINLVYCQQKQILVSIRNGFIKFMKIKQDGRISIEQIINLELQYDYLLISQDLRYLMISQKQLMSIFELNKK